MAEKNFSGFKSTGVCGGCCALLAYWGGLLRIVDAGRLGAVGCAAGGLVSDGEVLANVGIEAQGDENEQAEFADGEHEVEERGEQAVEVLEEVNHSDENF